MGSLSIWHWLIVLVIVMLIFGTKKLRNMGADLGGAVRGFKDGMREGAEKPADSPQVSGKTIEGEVKGKTEQAVVYDPIRDELFTATRGNGAQLNGYRIRVGKAKDLSGTILATGFPFKQKHHIESYLKMFQSMFIECADIRRAGSAALDLAYVAAGRFDAVQAFVR